MTGIMIFLKLVRANFLPASVAPFLLGSALAFREGYQITPFKFIAAMAGVISAHLAANTANNYYDYVSGADSRETVTTPFFGGTKVITSGEASTASALLTAVVLGFIAIFSGLAVFFVTKDPVFIYLTIGTAFLAAQYTAGPLRLSYRGFGEVVIFLLFGTLLVMGSFYLFSAVFSLESFLVSVIPGGLIFSVIVCNEIPDAETDIKAGKNTLVVILGRARGKALYAVGVCLSAIFFVCIVARGTLPPDAAVGMIFYVLAIRAFIVIKDHSCDIKFMTEAGKMTVMAHLLVTVTVAASLAFLG